MTSIESTVIQSAALLEDLSASEDDNYPSPIRIKFVVQSQSSSDSDANGFISLGNGSLSNDMSQLSLFKSQVPWDEVLDRLGNHGLSDTPLNIQGLSRDQFSPFDMYKPVIQVYPAPDGRRSKDTNVMNYLRSAPFLEHIDVTTTWKGISLTEAELLFQIHQVFTESLERVLIEDLRSLHLQFQQEFSSYHTENIYSSPLIRQMNFSRDDLMQSMISMLRPRGNWDIYLRLLPLYLSTCDCLKQIEGDESQATAVEVRVCYNRASRYLHPPGPVAEPAWIPDGLKFREIQQVQREGQELIIMPYYYTYSFSDGKDNDIQISYSITSSQSWLSWDDNIGGFKGTLPMYSELQGRDDRRHKVYPASPEDPRAILSILRIDLKALVTKGRLPGLRLERTLRARLTFEIIPWYAHISTCAQRNGLVRPFVTQFLAHASPTTSRASSESPPIKSNSSDDSSRLSEEFLRSVTHRKKASQIIETEISPPMPITSAQNSRKRRFVSEHEIRSPNKRYRETTCTFSATQSQISPDRSNSSIDRVLTVNESVSSLAKGRKQTLDPPPLHYPNRFPPLRDPGPKDDVGTQLSSSMSTNSLDSENQSSEGANKTRKCISDPKLCIDRKQLERIDSGYSSKETDIQGEQTADTIAYDAPVIKKRSVLSVLLNDVSHSIDAIAQEKLTRLGEGQHHYGFSDSSSGNSELSSRESSHDLSGSKKCSSPKDSTSIDSSRRCSSSIDMILEDSSVAPRLRREQAILWKALSSTLHDSAAGGSMLNVQERKDIYDAMKNSAEEEQNRRNEKLGLADVFDDLFVDDSSEVTSGEQDEMVESSSVHSEPLSEDSGLGSTDQGLEDSVNYGF